MLSVRFNMNQWLFKLMILAALFAYVFTLYFFQPKNVPTTVLTIDQNTSIKTVTQLLIDEQILEHPLFFKIALRLTKADKKIRSGTFEFSQPSSIHGILHTLTKGKLVLTEVVIPEGWNMHEIGSILEAKGICSIEDFLASCQDTSILSYYEIPSSTCEGYLLPETYQFAPNSSAKTVVTTMIDHLINKITPEHLDQLSTYNLNRHQWITLASIVEKEAANPTEYALIASVFYNRLKKDMRLESDPTIIYGLEDYAGDIRTKDIRKKHPYNTYVIKGLPPGPIASPGWGALMATLHPAQSEYLFFVADKNRKHVFSKTYAEHEKNVNLYQKRR
ncbi:MAG: endolytic transglycosylase MltG [Bdellovibrionales bacterium]|nr:endolytic transglycosylase MltG [Bdellovibrionales bacterium]